MLSIHRVNIQELTDVATLVDLVGILESMSNVIWDELLVEVTAEQTRNLKKIDEAFMKMKAALKTKDRGAKKKLLSESKKELLQQVKKFTGVSNINLTVSTDIGFNAMVAPSYQKTLSWKIIELSRDWPDNLQEFTKKYIEGFHLFLGTGLIERFEPRELTSILLHEFGHVFGHTKAMSFVVMHLLSMLQKVAVITSTISGTIILLLPAIFVVSRGIEFVNHREEYNSDNFATHHGYGQEMLSTFKKFHGMVSSKKRNFISKAIVKILRLLHWIVFPTSHPSNSKRICRIYREITDDYKSMYPKIGSKVLEIATEFKCDPRLLDKKLTQHVKDDTTEETTVKKLKDMFLAKRNKG